jgi:hypothetical protein
MNKQRDLLPWVLGALSVATVAVVVAVASSGKTIAPSVHPTGAAIAPLTATPDLPSTMPAPVAPIAPVASLAAVSATAASSSAASAPNPEAAPQPAAAALPAAPAQATAEPTLQAGQIWECVTNGVKTFSNNPCGEKSTLLEVRAINTMNPTPVVRYAHAYTPEPRYSPAYADPDSYSDQDVYSEQGGAESPVNSYAVVQGFAFLPRKRPEHPHRPPMHHNPGPPRRN